MRYNSLNVFCTPSAGDGDIDADEGGGWGPLGPYGR